MQTELQVALDKMRQNIVPDTSMCTIAEAFDDLLFIVHVLDCWRQSSDSIRFGVSVGKEDGDTLNVLVERAIAKVQGRKVPA